MSQLKVMKAAAAGGDTEIQKEKQGRGALPHLSPARRSIDV